MWCGLVYGVIFRDGFLRSIHYCITSSIHHRHPQHILLPFSSRWFHSFKSQILCTTISFSSSVIHTPYTVCSSGSIFRLFAKWQAELILSFFSAIWIARADAVFHSVWFTYSDVVCIFQEWYMSVYVWSTCNNALLWCVGEVPRNTASSGKKIESPTNSLQICQSTQFNLKAFKSRNISDHSSVCKPRIPDGFCFDKLNILNFNSFPGNVNRGRGRLIDHDVIYPGNLECLFLAQHL